MYLYTIDLRVILSFLVFLNYYDATTTFEFRLNVLIKNIFFSFVIYNSRVILKSIVYRSEEIDCHSSNTLNFKCLYFVLLIYKEKLNSQYVQKINNMDKNSRFYFIGINI